MASDIYLAFQKSLEEARGDAVLGVTQELALKWAEITEAESDGTPDSSESQELDLESKTWRLVQALYAERLDDDDRSAFASTSKNPYISPEELISRLSRADPGLSELQALCAWLESVAPSVDGEPRRGYLPHTKLMLKQAARLKSSKPPGTVSHLDPDATIREDARWADEDDKFEAGLSRTLFHLVRAGDIPAALDLCRQSDESWRAASLAGFRFYRDAGETSADDDAFEESRASRGNLNRQLWKRAARKLAQNTSLKLYERALYGHLSGETEAVLPACESWEDEIWAYANALLQSELDDRLADSQDGKFWFARSGQAERRTTASIKSSLQDIFERVQESRNDRARIAAAHPLRVAQRYLVLGQVDRLFDEFTTRLEETASTASEAEVARLIRFFAHLALFLRAAGQAMPSSANKVLEAYTRVLETHGVHDLVAYYASHLQSEEAVETFALYLQRSHPLLESRQARFDQLMLAQQHNVEVADVARRTVELILADAIADAPVFETQGLFGAHTEPSTTDWELIRSIEWLTFFEETYVDALRYANALTRYFLAAGRSSAAREILTSLPQTLPAFVAAQSNGGEDPLNGLLTEHSDYRLLFGCLQAYVQWSDVWSRRPAKKQTRYALQPYNETLTMASTSFYNATTELLSLKWLHRDEDTLDEVHGMNAVGRLHELSIVRQIYVPELIFRLHHVLFETHTHIPNNLQLAIDLVQIVADERLQLWREFIGSTPGSNRLPDLLDRVKQTSLAALDISNSPFLVSSAAS